MGLWLGQIKRQGIHFVDSSSPIIIAVKIIHEDVEVTFSYQ